MHNHIAQNSSLLDAALAYAERGWRVIPVHGITAGGDCTCGADDCSSPGKHPLISAWQKKATTDPDTIRGWFTAWPNINIGIATGSASGIAVLDVDAITLLNGWESSTLTAQTGKGRHLYFALDGTRVRNSAGKLSSGLDMRGDGGFVVAPPSRHASGKHYAWVNPTASLQPLPVWTLTNKPIPNGQRNDSLFKIGCAMIQRGESVETIEAELLSVNADRCIPPLPGAEVKAIAASAARYEAAAVSDDQLSDSLDDLIEDAEQNPAVAIVENLVYRGDRIVIHGYEGTMKSLFGMALADAIARGTTFLGELKTSAPLRVGIIETEMRNPRLGERLKKLYPDRATRPKNLLFFSRQKLDEFRHCYKIEERLKIVRKWIEKEEIRIVIWDVISDLFCGGRSPDKEEDVTFVFDQLQLIPNVEAWVLFRHDSKPKASDDANTNNRIRGSSEWKENPDTVVHLTSNGRSGTVSVGIGKLRYGEKPASFEIRYDKTAGTVVPGNPILWLLAQLGSRSREELVKECIERYGTSDRTVARWLEMVKQYLSESHIGHQKIFDRDAQLHPELLWKPMSYEDEE